MLRYTKALLAAVTLALLSFAAASAAQAATVVHVSHTTFDSAAGANVSTITFGNTGTSLTNSLTYTGVTFAGGTDYQVEVIDGLNVGAPGNFVLTSNSNAITPGGPNIVITPPANTLSFGFDIKSSNAALGSLGTGSYQILVNGTPMATVTPTYASFSFIGFTSDAPITSITITSLSGGDPVLDNVAFGPAAAPTETPEPATLVLLGTGLAGAAGVARRRRRLGKEEAVAQA